MQQPELGKKIAELRTLKGMTQEELAEKCYLNVRSIQRLEAGDVVPRMSTLNTLSEVLDYRFNSEAVSTTNLWILLLHLTNLIPLVVIGLIIWVWKKEEIPEMNVHGVRVLNFQITMWIMLMCSIPLIVPLPFIGIYIWIITILNIIKVSVQEEYRYPLSYSFIKEKL